MASTLTETTRPPVSVLMLMGTMLVASRSLMPPSPSPMIVTTLGLGATRSSTKLASAFETFPAASVALAAMVIVPSPRRLRSFSLRTIGVIWPLPVNLRVIVRGPLARTTSITAPFSAGIEKTPAGLRASAAVAPPATPAAKLMFGSSGATVSTLKSSLAATAAWRRSASPLLVRSLIEPPLSRMALAAMRSPSRSIRGAPSGTTQVKLSKLPPLPEE